MDEMEKIAAEYAELAQALLEENGQPYGDDDIVKVASFLIDADYEQEEVDEDAIRAAAFYDELEKSAGARMDKAKANAGKAWNWVKDKGKRGTEATKGHMKKHYGKYVAGAGGAAAGGAAGYMAGKGRKKKASFNPFEN
jgi:hypothetical protein